MVRKVMRSLLHAGLCLFLIVGSFNLTNFGLSPNTASHIQWFQPAYLGFDSDVITRLSTPDEANADLVRLVAIFSIVALLYCVVAPTGTGTHARTGDISYVRSLHSPSRARPRSKSRVRTRQRPYIL